MKTLILSLFVLGASLSLNAQNIKEIPSSSEGVELLAAALSSGKSAPLSASIREFDSQGLTQHQRAMADVIRSGSVDLNDSAQRALYYKVLAPAAQTLIAGVATSSNEARSLNLDLTDRVQAARDIFATIGSGSSSSSYAQGTFGFSEAERRSFGGCNFVVYLGDEDEENLGINAHNAVSIPGRDNNTSVAFFGDAGEMGFVVPLPLNQNCGVNNKCCEASDDALADATCKASTNEDCSRTTRNGVRVCAAASDDCE